MDDTCMGCGNPKRMHDGHSGLHHPFQPGFSTSPVSLPDAHPDSEWSRRIQEHNRQIPSPMGADELRIHYEGELSKIMPQLIRLREIERCALEVAWEAVKHLSNVPVMATDLLEALKNLKKILETDPAG